MDGYCNRWAPKIMISSESISHTEFKMNYGSEFDFETNFSNFCQRKVL